MEEKDVSIDDYEYYQAEVNWSCTAVVISHRTKISIFSCGINFEW